MMRGLSLKAKFGLSFGALLLITICLGGVGYTLAWMTDSLAHKVQFNTGKKDLTLAIQLAVEKEKSAPYLEAADAIGFTKRVLPSGAGNLHLCLVEMGRIEVPQPRRRDCLFLKGHSGG